MIVAVALVPAVVFVVVCVAGALCLALCPSRRDKDDTL